MTAGTKRTAVVTGGAGFIGSHLVEHLLADGHRVRVIDNFASGRPENLNAVKNDPALSVIEGSVTDLALMRRTIRDVDWVFHLAGLADVVPSIQRPLDYHHVNVDGTVSALIASAEHNVQKFLYAASSSCYGIPNSYPTPESAPIRPMYPYALTKNVGEQYVIHWARVYRLPAIALRLFNVYGPRSRTSGAYGAVFGVFLAQKLAGEPFTVVGDGTQTRDFTFVTDVARAFIAAANSPFEAEVFNVGSGRAYSVNRLTELLGGPVVHVPKRPAEPDCTFADDISKIERMLGWRAQVSIEGGVREMLENIEYWRAAPVWRPETIAQATEEWVRCLT